MTIITPAGFQAETVNTPSRPNSNEAQYRQFLASLAFELYSSHVDPNMDVAAQKDTAGWALEAAVVFIDAVNGFDL